MADETVSAVRNYRVPILVFLLALFIGLTLAHPAIFLNDEFITTNQLYQLHAGHQVVSNEGKYGLMENGSMSYYFAARSNILGYTLFLPLISLPTYALIDITGQNFVYLVLILWMIVLLIILLIIDRFYHDHTFVGKRNWIPAAYVAAFILFFINLYFYATFPVDSFNTYPEIMAIVFTNIFLLAITAVLIYEILTSVFANTAYSFFGTLVCLFSSSYFVWATHCKDHILVLPLFAAIFLCLIRFILQREYWYLPLAFLLSGLLAWVRPELALWICLFVCCICGYSIIHSKLQGKPVRDILPLIVAPFYTIIGALPFFLNNYMVTKNFLLPVQSLYLTDATSSALTVHATGPWVRVAEVKSVQSVILMFVPKISTTPQDYIFETAGVFFYPRTGSISVFALVPLFLVMAIILCAYLWRKKILLSSDEKKVLVVSLLISAMVFLAYASQIHILYADMGIIPDIRYFTPMYLPLMVIGLIILKKTDLLPENPWVLLRNLCIVGLAGLVFALTLVTLAYFYTIPVPLGKYYSLYISALAFITLIVILGDPVLKLGKAAGQYLILLLCVLPFFWQVTCVIVVRSVSGYAGYSFWIPVTRVIWEIVVNAIV